MLRRVGLLPLVLAAVVAGSLTGCSGNSKSDAPRIQDKPPANMPKKLTPSGGGGRGKPQGPGSSSE